MILGWAGTAALLLASAYFVRLAISEGWVTPWLQVGIATAAAFAMIAASFALRRGDARYSSLLGAGGIAILYLAVYGAHVYHGLIGPWVAILAVGMVSALSLLLHLFFRQTIYVAFALAGTYLTPLLLPGGTIQDFAIYLAIWNVVFGLYAVWQKNRGLYLAAAYAFLIVFSLLWSRAVGEQIDRAFQARMVHLDFHALPRTFAGIFLFLQACLFVTASVGVSLRSRKPLTRQVAWLHFPALMLLYQIQQTVWGGGSPVIPYSEHSDIAAWAGIALAVMVYTGWAVGRVALDQAPNDSLLIAHAFAAVVFVHAVFLKLVAPGWRPLVACAVAAATLIFWSAFARAWPFLAMAAFLFLVGYIAAAFPSSIPNDVKVVGRSGLLLAYPALLYILYFKTRHARGLSWLLLTIAHAMTLGAAAWLVEEWLGTPDSTIERLWLSFAWAGIGLGWLLTAIARGDRTLASSTLGIFGAFAIKVVFEDLDHAGPLVRIGILLVLGLTLYAGGWIYRRRVLAPITRTQS